jgi:transglycosylase-like protein with SLT domain
MSLRRKFLGILSELVPAGIVGVSMLLGSAAPSRAFGDGNTPPASEAGMLDRLSSAVEGAESSHGADAHMWRLELEGPQGPMQISAAAASDVGGGDRFDEAQNRALGRAYLAHLYRRYGSWPDAVAAYNWGPGRMNSWIGSGRPVDRFPPAVAQYRGRVTVTSGLAADASGTVVGGPVNGRLTRLALLRALARWEMIARRRTRSGPDEVALLYAEIMQATAPAVR